MSKSEQARPYQMQARQEAVDENRERILRAMVELWLERHYDDVTLGDVAERAGVSRQTIFRQFGSKDDVLAAAARWAAAQMDEQRAVAPGDVAAAVREALASYEVMGDANVRSLEIEGRHPVIDEMLERGRASHRAWIEATFAPQLPPPSDSSRESVVFALYAATDVTVWKLLRRDFALSRTDTELVVRRLVDGALTDAGNPEEDR